MRTNYQIHHRTMREDVSYPHFIRIQAIKERARERERERERERNRVCVQQRVYIYIYVRIRRMAAACLAVVGTSRDTIAAATVSVWCGHSWRNSAIRTRNAFVLFLLRCNGRRYGMDHRKKISVSKVQRKYRSHAHSRISSSTHRSIPSGGHAKHGE